MENLFDILIILFIIYAFLAPFFKKKPLPKTKPPQFPQDNEKENFEIKTSQRSIETKQDILREIEELFGIPPSTKEDETFLTEEESLKEDEFSLEDKLKLQDEFKSKLSQSYPTKPKPFAIDLDIADYKIDQFDYEWKSEEYEIEQYDYEKTMEEPREDIKLSTFTFSISEPDDFKRAIIYKEIFDSPIALRVRKIKWQRSIY